MQHEAQALKRHDTTIVTADSIGTQLLLVGMLGLTVRMLRKIQKGAADEEIKERVEIAANGLDGIAATMRRKLGIPTS